MNRRARQIHGKTAPELAAEARARDTRWSRIRDYLIDDADLMDAVARTIAAEQRPDIQS